MRAPRWRSVVPITMAFTLATVVLTGAARLVVGSGSLGYDAAYALAWAQELAGGGTPSFDAGRAPTPHPLLNGAALLASLSEGHEADVLLFLMQLGLGAVVVGAGLLAWRLAGPVAGALAGVAVITRAPLVDNALDGGVDVGFVALVVAALAVDAWEPRRPTVALGLLAAAGMLRPEAWLLSVAYVLLRREEVSTSRVLAGVLVVAAPVIWCVTDLLVTGNPIWSLTGTRDLAAELNRPRGVAASLELFPRYVVSMIGGPIALGGTVGCIAALWLHPARFGPALGVLLLSSLGFVVLGLLGLPLITRYVALPGVLLVVFCGALAGMAAPVGRTSTWSAACLLAAIAVVAVTLPGQVRGLATIGEDAAARSDVQRDLELVAQDDAVAAAARKCPVVWSPTHRPVPFVARVLKTPARDVRQGYPPDDATGVFFALTSLRAASVFHLQGAERAPAPTPVPAGFVILAREGAWVAAARCQAHPTPTR